MAPCGLVTQCAHEILPHLAAHGITLQLDALDQLGLVALHPHSFRRVPGAQRDRRHAAGRHLTLQGRRQAATVSLTCGIPAAASPSALPDF